MTRWSLTPLVYGIEYPGAAMLVLGSALAFSVARRRSDQRRLRKLCNPAP
jgi:hypothetical protein